MRTVTFSEVIQDEIDGSNKYFADFLLKDTYIYSDFSRNDIERQREYSKIHKLFISILVRFYLSTQRYKYPNSEKQSEVRSKFVKELMIPVINSLVKTKYSMELFPSYLKDDVIKQVESAVRKSEFFDGMYTIPKESFRWQWWKFKTLIDEIVYYKLFGNINYTEKDVVKILDKALMK